MDNPVVWWFVRAKFEANVVGKNRFYTRFSCACECDRATREINRMTECFLAEGQKKQKE